MSGDTPARPASSHARPGPPRARTVASLAGASLRPPPPGPDPRRRRPAWSPSGDPSSNRFEEGVGEAPPAPRPGSGARDATDPAADPRRAAVPPRHGDLRRAAPRGAVLKVGGSVVDGPGLGAVLEGVAALHAAGVPCVVVHGGGPLVTRTLERLGLESRFDAGLRVTDDAAMEAVEMTLSARVNQALVGDLARRGVPAVGLSGRDGGLLRAEPHARAGELGRVGRIASVDATALRALADAGFVPVVSPVSAGRDGGAWNVNADHAAGALAAALRVDALVLATDVPGLRGACGETVRELTADDALDLIRRGVAVDGMRPKVEACAGALGAGVERAHLVPGDEPGVLEAAVLDRPGAGTAVRGSDGRLPSEGGGADDGAPPCDGGGGDDAPPRGDRPDGGGGE